VALEVGVDRDGSNAFAVIPSPAQRRVASTANDTLVALEWLQISHGFSPPSAVCASSL
jgi:hypothetical protein